MKGLCVCHKGRRAIAYLDDSREGGEGVHGVRVREQLAAETHVTLGVRPDDAIAPFVRTGLVGSEASVGSSWVKLG
jgi:hypothetical protein